MTNAELMADYILSSEVDDFEEQLRNDEYSITGYERRLLLDWINDEVDTTLEVKAVFKKMRELDSRHIYVIAICELYKIE